MAKAKPLQTEAEVLEACREKKMMSKSEFAHALGIPRTQYFTYLNGVQQDLAGLQWSAVKHVGTWIGDLAVELLKARGAAVPCKCETELWDNGPCPKHGAPSALRVEEHKQYEEDQKLEVSA
jgi:hypothetical protein